MLQIYVYACDIVNMHETLVDRSSFSLYLLLTSYSVTSCRDISIIHGCFAIYNASGIFLLLKSSTLLCTITSNASSNVTNRFYMRNNIFINSHTTYKLC